ncbi:MAG: TPM domain-containing protein, partial [Gemmatimonas sp.]
MTAAATTLLVAVAALCLPLGPLGPLAAQPPALPQPVGYVNDFANVIAPDAEARLVALAERLNAATRGDMVIVTLPDLGGRPVEEVSLRLGREWKIGANAAIGDAARNAG